MDELSPKEFLKIWEKQYIKLDEKLKVKFLKDERLRTILNYSKKDILLAVYSNQKLDEIITFLGHHRNTAGKSKAIQKDDKFDKAINLKKNATKAEKLLWSKLQNNKLDLHFEFQYILKGYICDFYFPEGKMVIELDGGIHKNQAGADARRSQILGMENIAVYRFSNKDVFEEVDEVVSRSLRLAQKRLKSNFEPEILYAKRKTIILRCEKCKKTFQSKSKNTSCFTCHTNQNVIRICNTCKLRPTLGKLVICKKCLEARKISKIEVGASKQKWGQGSHRARKIN